MKEYDARYKVGLVFLLTLLFEIVLSFFPINLIITSRIGSMIYSDFVLSLFPILYIVFSKEKFKDIIGLKKMKVSNILLCMLFALLVNPLMTLINGISMQFSSNKITNVMLGLQEEAPFLLALLLTAIMPAFLEEMVYRGLLYNTFRKFRPIVGGLLSALIFGLVHGNLNQFCYAFFMGMVFALVFEATDSILATMVIHFTVNAYSVVIMYVVPYFLNIVQRMYDNAVALGDGLTSQSISDMMGGTDFSMSSLMANASNEEYLSLAIMSAIIPAIIGTTLAVLVFILIAKRSGRWEHIKCLFSKKYRMRYEMNPVASNMVTDNKALLTWPLVAGMIISLLILISNELVLRGIIQ